jgi:hypothetical protein
MKAPYFILPMTLVAFTATRAAEKPATETQSGPEGESSELAMKLQNPVAALVSVPFQNNYDSGAGPTGDGEQYKLNFQPVIPISLNHEWNLISRTILPYINQDDVIGTDSQYGLGDTVQSLFLSPVNPTSSGWIWGAGPVLQLPTATDDLLGEEKWGAGPTAVFLKQMDGWTAGALVNHIWSFAGEEDRADVNRTFLQPFVSYTTKTHTSFGLNTETSYDWTAEQWSVPINLFVQQILKIGDQPFAVQLGGRYYAEGPDDGPEWGLRLQVTLMFPR